jgi:aminoglycoside/choline kinase family phosphotransferase
VILVRYSLEREENGLYSRHARFLKSIGLPAPAILLDAPAKNFFVMQDLGDQSLQSLAKTWPQARLSHFYQLVLASIARWHTEGGCAARRRRLALVAPFSPDLYRWEREFFIRNFLQPRLHPAPETVRQIADELAAVSADLLKAPAVLVHRDLQSSNILRAGRRPFFIDFQGMRFGAAAYDLASLLCDPYIELPLAETEQLLDAYNRMVNRRQGVSGELFWLAAIERLAQALGAYGRLGANPETAWFGKYIAPGLRMMRRAIEQSGACPRLASLLQRYGDKMN